MFYFIELEEGLVYTWLRLRCCNNNNNNNSTPPNTGCFYSKKYIFLFNYNCIANFLLGGKKIKTYFELKLNKLNAICYRNKESRLLKAKKLTFTTVFIKSKKCLKISHSFYLIIFFRFIECCEHSYPKHPFPKEFFA